MVNFKIIKKLSYSSGIPMSAVETTTRESNQVFDENSEEFKKNCPKPLITNDKYSYCRYDPKSLWGI